MIPVTFVHFFRNKKFVRFSGIKRSFSVQGGGGEAVDSPAGGPPAGQVQTSDRQLRRSLRASPHRQAARSQASLHSRGIRRQGIGPGYVTLSCFSLTVSHLPFPAFLLLIFSVVSVFPCSVRSSDSCNTLMFKMNFFVLCSGPVYCISFVGEPTW